MARHRFTGDTPPGLSGGGGGAGDVVGPASATDDAIARFDGGTGKIIQSSGVSISDTDTIQVFDSGGDEKVRVAPGSALFELASNVALRWRDDLDIASGAAGPQIVAGTGTPEGSVAAKVGSLYLRTNGGAGTTLYVKESGVGNTGWVGK